jgi:hypothetical protein
MNIETAWWICVGMLVAMAVKMAIYARRGGQ